MEPDEKLYFRLRNAFEIIARVNNRLEVTGAENIPEEGCALICPRHENYSDPIFVGAAVKNRMLHFLAWHGVLDIPLLGPLFERTGAMHNIRESYGVAEDKEEARRVLGKLEDALRGGELCVIFPEGAINHWIGKGGVKEFKTGAVRLAARAGAPIIPTGLTGTRWVVANIINFRDWGGPDRGIGLPTALPVKVRVEFGKPFYADPKCAGDREIAERETERLRRRVMEIVEGMKGNRFFELF